MREALRVGTRGSPLALAQTREVLRHLRLVHPDVACETVVIRTHGDEGYQEDLGTPLDGKRAFTKRIEDALLSGRIDFAVHSLKDVPTELESGLEIAARPPRADPRDVFLANDGLALDSLPPGTRVGTGSLRRKAQLLARWPFLKVEDLHGNLGTRLRRLDAQDFEAIVVAAAGLDRLQLKERTPEPIPPEILTPAPGQGALALECRAGDDRVRDVLQTIDDPATRSATDSERALSTLIGGDCNVPFGALATVEGDMMRLRGVVASPDGRRIVRAEAQGSRDAWRGLVDAVGSRLLHGGADQILAEVR